MALRSFTGKIRSHQDRELPILVATPQVRRDAGTCAMPPPSKNDNVDNSRNTGGPLRELIRASVQPESAEPVAMAAMPVAR